MKKQEILEGNRLIAEFMNFTFEPWYGEDRLGDNKTDTEYCYDEDGNVIDKLFYNSSWDWLMSVVSKCLTINEKELDEWEYYYTQIDDSFFVVEITETYAKVVNFIKWYNNEHSKRTKNN